LLNTAEVGVDMLVEGVAAASMAVVGEAVPSTAAAVPMAAAVRTVEDENTAAANIEAAQSKDPDGWLEGRAGCPDAVEELDRDAATEPRLIVRRTYVPRSTTANGIRSGMAGALHGAVRLARIRT
jgi:hypothetical protein